MCGIAGVFVKRGVDWRPDKNFLRCLWEGIEVRGRDATGYGTLEDSGGLYMYKGPLAATEFIPDFLEQSPENSPIGPVTILHTRAATLGTPKVNANNHPLPWETESSSVLVVHNGQVGNLDETYAALNVERKVDVDSQVIAAALGELGPVDGLKLLEKESCGTAAIAAVFEDGRLLLARSGNPIMVGQPRPGVMVWASLASVIEPLCAVPDLGLPFWKVCAVPDDWYQLWSPDGRVLATGTWKLKTMWQGKRPVPVGYTPGPAPVHGMVYPYADYTDYEGYSGDFKNRHAGTPDNVRVMHPCGKHEDKSRGSVRRYHSCEYMPNKQTLLADPDDSPDPAPGTVDLLATNAGIDRSEFKRALAGLGVATESSQRIPTAVVPKNKDVSCFFGGCWKRAYHTLKFDQTLEGTVVTDWLPLCQNHLRKVSTNVDKFYIDQQGDVMRKSQRKPNGHLATCDTIGSPFCQTWCGRPEDSNA